MIFSPRSLLVPMCFPCFSSFCSFFPFVSFSKIDKAPKRVFETGVWNQFQTIWDLWVSFWKYIWIKLTLVLNCIWINQFQVISQIMIFNRKKEKIRRWETIWWIFQKLSPEMFINFSRDISPQQLFLVEKMVFVNEGFGWKIHRKGGHFDGKIHRKWRF